MFTQKGFSHHLRVLGKFEFQNASKLRETNLVQTNRHPSTVLGKIPCLKKEVIVIDYLVLVATTVEYSTIVRTATNNHFGCWLQPLWLLVVGCWSRIV